MLSPTPTPPPSPSSSRTKLPGMATEFDKLFSLSPLSSLELLPETLDPCPSFQLDGPSHQDSAAAEQPNQAPAKDRKSCRKASRRVARLKRRTKARESVYGYYRSSSRARERYQDAAEAIECDLDLEHSGVTSSGYTGLDDGLRPRREWKLEEVTGPGSQFNFKLVPWDGRHVFAWVCDLCLLIASHCSTPAPVIDKQRRVVTVLAGHPDDVKWPLLQASAAAALEDCRPRVRVPPKARRHRRGVFKTLSSGVSHGNGQTQPANVKNEGENGRVVRELGSMEPFKRIAGHASGELVALIPISPSLTQASYYGHLGSRFVCLLC